MPYRESMLRQAGFEFPDKTRRFFEICKAPQGQIEAGWGSRMGKAVGDGNNFAHWIVWSHGGKMVDESGKVVINCPRPSRRCICPRALPDLHPGHRELARHQQQPRLPRRRHLGDGNGVSLYYSAKNDPEDGRHGG